MRALFAAMITTGCSAEDAASEPLVDAPRDGELDSCEAVDNPMVLRADFLARLFPLSANDDAIFCAFNLGTNVCTPQGPHTGGILPFGGTPPTEAACRASSGATLLACDRYAKHVITAALDSGSLIDLLRGVTRMRDVMNRPGVPTYYAASSPNNRFATWLQSANVDLPGLGPCTTGSDDAGYACLVTNAHPPARRTIRGLLQLLEQHNGVLARHGMLAGASERQAAIFASATAPLQVRLVQTNTLAPVAGPGVQRVHALAKAFALRLLDGSADAGPETELEAFLQLPSYQPVGGPSQLARAGIGLLAAQMAAYGWDEQADAAITQDLQIAGDLHDFARILKMTARTAQALGSCDRVPEYGELIQHVGGTTLFGANFPAKSFVPGPANMNALTLSELGNVWSFDEQDFVDDCRLHQALVAVRMLYVEEVVVVGEEHFGNGVTRDGCVLGSQWVDANMNTGEISACRCLEFDATYDETGVHQDGCTEWEVTISDTTEAFDWLDYGESPTDENEIVDSIVAATINKRRVHEAYNQLLSSDDDRDGDLEQGEVYDHIGDDRPDLHHSEDVDAHMSILRTSVGWPECQAELVASSSTYGSEVIDELSCSHSGVNSACVSENADSNLFVPYAIAMRACPQYTARVTGVLDSDFDIDRCATPWSFTQAVEFYLENDGVPDDVIATYPEYGSDVKPLVVDFAAEAIALAQPAAAMYRHRADFASVAGDVPGAVPEDLVSTWYDDNSGLAIVDASQATGESVMAAGIDLFTAFEALEVWGESGRNIIARLSGDAYEGCTDGDGCDENGRLHIRALAYRRLRDAIETYAQLGGGRIETQWRRLDGLQCFDDDGENGYDRCGSCIVGVDTSNPPDGQVDGLDCKANLDLDHDGDHDDCTAQCQYFDAATAMADAGSARMSALADVLDAHSHRASLDPAQQDFVGSAAAFARGTGEQLTRDYDAMLAGTDWLGYRVGLWYPGVDVDEKNLDVSARVDAAMDELRAAAAAAHYDQNIAAYLQRVSDLHGWAQQVGQTNQDAGNQIAHQCSGGIDACSSEWRSDYVAVALVNDALEAALCNRKIKLWHIGPNGSAVRDQITLGPTGTDCFEDLVSPDLDAVAMFTGALPEEAAKLGLQLAQIEATIADVDAYIELIQANNVARKKLGQVLDDEITYEKKRESLQDGVTCGSALLGSAAIAITAAAADSPVQLVQAIVEAGEVCAGVAVNGDSFSNKPTQAELQAAYDEYTTTLEVDEEAYTLAVKLSAIDLALAQYLVLVTEYRGLEADLVRTGAYSHTVLDDLVHTPLFDPSLQLFDEESLGAMKASFRTVAKQARDVHHLVQYDIGQTIREGATFSVDDSDTFYLPQLSTITILQSYSADTTDALDQLRTSTGDAAGLPGERSYNLLSYASLLEYVHDQFLVLYGDRLTNASPVYIGAPQCGFAGCDADGDGDVDQYDADLSNPGDRAMLGDSPFYDPLRAPASLAPSGCPLGTIDLADYCTVFEDGTVVADNTCFDVTKLDVLSRYSLAYVDHMTRGIGVETFACSTNVVGDCTAYHEDGSCAQHQLFPVYIAVAPDENDDGIFTYGELGGTPGFFDPTDTDYYNAQTATVRGIIDRFVAERDLHDDKLDSDDLEVRPGTYLWLVDMQSSAAFDPEEDLTFGEHMTHDSISEQLTSIALLCTDQVSCADETEGYDADIIFLGPGYLGDRCQERTTRRQERVAFQMDPDAVHGIPARKLISADTLDEDAALVLADPGTRDLLSAQPLQGSSWIVTMRGHSDASGDGLPLGWPLYYHEQGSSSPGPRVRLALQYSYFDASVQAGDFEYDVEGLLECNNASDATMCVNGTCD